MTSVVVRDSELERIYDVLEVVNLTYHRIGISLLIYSTQIIGSIIIILCFQDLSDTLHAHTFIVLLDSFLTKII